MTLSNHWRTERWRDIYESFFYLDVRICKLYLKTTRHRVLSLLFFSSDFYICVFEIHGCNLRKSTSSVTGDTQSDECVDQLRSSELRTGEWWTCANYFVTLSGANILHRWPPNMVESYCVEWESIMECLGNHQNETTAVNHGLHHRQPLSVSDPVIDLLHCFLCESPNESFLSGREIILSIIDGNVESFLQRKRPIGTYICLGLLVIVYLLGIGDGIYVAFRVKKSTSSIEQTINEINGQIYPKEIADHLTYINQQIRRLNDYSSRRKKERSIVELFCTVSLLADSILINASKSMLDTTFKDILRVKYFLPDLLQRVNETNEYFKQLNTTVREDPALPQPVKDMFGMIEDEHRRMIDYLNSPLKELCNYNNATDTDIDQELLTALDSLHQVLKKLIKIIGDDILQNITPWENHLLISKDRQSTIRHYVNLVGTIGFALIIALVAIPLIFFLWICLSRLCCAPHNQREHLLS